MGNPVLVVRHFTSGEEEGRKCYVWCPGCDQLHAMSVPKLDGERGSAPVWSWDGDEERPTFDPSILVYHSVDPCGPHEDEVCPRAGQWGNCHSYLREGVWDFLGDSAHQMAGQKVPMVELPDWVVQESKESRR